jgi:hypothetical protein
MNGSPANENTSPKTSTQTPPSPGQQAKPTPKRSMRNPSGNEENRDIHKDWRTARYSFGAMIRAMHRLGIDHGLDEHLNAIAHRLEPWKLTPGPRKR